MFGHERQLLFTALAAAAEAGSADAWQRADALEAVYTDDPELPRLIAARDTSALRGLLEPWRSSGSAHREAR